MLSDEDQLVELFDGYRQFYRQPADLGVARRFLRERAEKAESVILVADDGEGALAGFVQLYPSFSSVSAARIYVLNDLFVAPAYRQRGVARALLAEAATFGLAVGAARLELSTAHTNTPAQKLYESLGWQKDTEFLHYQLPMAAKRAGGV